MSQQHLVLNGRSLPNAGTLSSCGVKDNDLIVVRRRQHATASTQRPAQTSAPASANAAARPAGNNGNDLASILSESLAGMMKCVDEKCVAELAPTDRIVCCAVQTEKPKRFDERCSPTLAQ